ncbi:hypothetical protein AX16_005149 [Volvariella volvacea WC 439]|nr:hypothetical protein AX16_005149 [Volvariella volvacea WC 439]
MSTVTAQDANDSGSPQSSSMVTYYSDAGVVRMRDITHHQNTTTVNIDTVNVHQNGSPQFTQKYCSDIFQSYSVDSAFYQAQSRPRNDDCEWAIGTRTEAEANYLEWMQTSNSTPSFFLVTGSVGTGKSALMRRHIKSAIDEGCIVLHFFFSENDDKRDSLGLVMTTFAYQLANSDLESSKKLLSITTADRTVLFSTPPYQWDNLIIKTLEAVDPTINTRIMVALDGLHVCKPAEQEQIIRVLNTSRLPLKILLSTRPQKRIYDFFGIFGNDFTSCLPSNLRVTDLSSSSAKEDMEVVARKGYPNLEGDPLQELVKSSDGQPSIHKYLQNPKSRYTDIDEQYNNILYKARKDGDKDLITLILYHLAYLDDINGVCIDTISRFWKKESHEIRIALDHLYSVVSIPSEDNKPLQILHTSFKTFLKERSTCQDFATHKKKLASQAFLRCLELAVGLSSSLSPCPELEFPSTLYARWIDIGPQLCSESGINLPYVKARLKLFNFERWKHIWMKLPGSPALPNGDKFRSWIQTFSKKELSQKFVFDPSAGRIIDSKWYQLKWLR